MLFTQQILKNLKKMLFNRRLVSPVGKAPSVVREVSGSIPGRTNTQGLKIIEEKVLPLL